jgi:hypothetical protein
MPRPSFAPFVEQSIHAIVCSKLFFFWAAMSK